MPILVDVDVDDDVSSDTSVTLSLPSSSSSSSSPSSLFTSQRYRFVDDGKDDNDATAITATTGIDDNNNMVDKDAGGGG
ncbi:unnamed protein product [Cercopithifilaria johnstoni]|uniref:Uncharacterized protein n=1 Tax=Cercopithifilaria johnstoni TaxID=2874296 RepID=A0A8J2M6G1_9BILA|nr:unnamed protein product [Cercopithifilaria johnstoni]